MSKEKKTISDVHRFYKTQVNNPVDYKTFRAVCNDFNKIFVGELLEGRVKEMYNRLGKLCIVKLPTDYTNPKVDYKSTKELGKVVYHTNIHSEGFYARFIWIKNKMRSLKLGRYRFTPTWTNKRVLSKLMQEEGGHKRFLIRQSYL